MAIYFALSPSIVGDVHRYMGRGGGGGLQPPPQKKKLGHFGFFWAAREIWAKQIFKEVCMCVCVLFFCFCFSFQVFRREILSILN